MDTTQNPNLETHQDLIFSIDDPKNHNLETTHNNNIKSSHNITSFKRTHEEIICIKKMEHEVMEETTTVVVEESGRDKLKRHRMEMSGRVWIPDIWGQEDLLNKWIDCTVFDSCVEKTSIMSARDALIQEGRSTLTIENSC
ncbi:hypothetical protein QVD17_22634 [Tagetes erecta]|uniref:Protein BIC1 n=1 Tax=Tagetes erecta TaxID=13708 RepID=A0AAD8KD69_TARER|nr:hypothetical protein QVD17_22634 [Tagetes erecta]